MITSRGIAVSPGIAIAEAVVLEPDASRVRKRLVAPAEVDRELQRFESALSASAEEVRALSVTTAETLGPELAKIFAFHAGMLADEHLLGQVRHSVRNDRVTADYAVYAVLSRLASTFSGHRDPYFRERVTDIQDLQRRILGKLHRPLDLGLAAITGPCILVARDLTPSQTATLDTAKVKGLVTDYGGRTSHTAILAHALGIPAIVGLEHATRDVNTGDTLVVDGKRGVLIVDPDAPELLAYREENDRDADREQKRGKLRDVQAVTRDGTPIELLANIEFASEIPGALDNGAEGVGLFRTEFLYLAAAEEPTEEGQLKGYRDAIRHLAGRPLTIRTLDLGADKLSGLAGVGEDDHERNPFLGCRSIRLSLQNLPMFKRQLRAILRASAEGPVRIMFPLISGVMELRQAKMVLNDVIEDLDDEGIAFDRSVEVGMMIEVPSVAIQARCFAEEVDFFSIGTNDLVQYTLAVDRCNERVAPLYSACHPAVLMLLKEVIRAADRTGIPVSLCGEMAGQPEYVMLLLGLGLRRFSMTPPAIPEVKQVLRAVSIEQCRRVAGKASRFDSDREVLNFVRDELSRVLPEVYSGRA
ncbi:phosphoenolpyruvate--protein phosphotransferase [Phycisphaera mikurensis]|uniref:Phosphoenolpyruvate-protein phosphotransferase n=1 Tax=Phycisphaera mikurensis (strain NBRC 102666 / KCTC 22515 / FYK2301M01) TaxID=1142394 RepID=I0IH76_PHYMF|nr:phosphoenolpyruvate--protein phosphotransferase [Phycisphaera mikurensis]MBB6440865.1 phosphotransferase system enzyme I (PtsI) [Phycisphaera mikurensis]BAM04614.1 phosphoenolpyruvate-protein phosphotransferase [Phycisphaera mikurensis NBRC 102666]